MAEITFESIKQAFKSNKTIKLATYAVGGVVVLFLGYFAYKQFIAGPKEEKSQDAYWSGLNLAVKDSTELAIEELKIAANKYDGYTGGEIAQFTLATQYMKKGEYKKAISELESVDVEDTYVSVMRIGLLGDCYSELKDYKKAISFYDEAANEQDNEMTTPTYLFKAGLVAEELKDVEAARKYYEQIKENYPVFSSRKQIEKYIARVSALEKK